MYGCVVGGTASKPSGLSTKHARNLSNPSLSLPSTGSYDDVFSHLDVLDSNSLTVQQLHNFHMLIHGCTCHINVVQQVMDAMVTCNSNNFEECLKSIHVLCVQSQQCIWDFQTLGWEENGGGLKMQQAELLWAANQAESALGKFEEFLVKKVKADKKPVQSIKYNDIGSELLKMPNFKEMQ